MTDYNSKGSVTEKPVTEKPVTDKPTTRSLRMGLIGAGRIAQDYLAAADTLDGVQFVAVADQDSNALKQLANRDLPTHETHQRLLLEHDLEAVLIATPPNTHEELATLSLNSGCHVLCEKPLAHDLRAAQRMLNAAQRSDKRLMMGSKFRFVDDVMLARELIAEGTIGEIVHFENLFAGVVDMSQRWNSKPKISGGGVLIDNGPHSIELARTLLGDIVKVIAVFGRRLQHLEVEDTARILFESIGGGSGLIDLSWSLDKRCDWYARVTGSNGTLQLRWQGSRYRKHGDDEWTAFGTGYSKIGAFTNQLQHFADVVRGTTEPRSTVQDGFEANRVIDACYRSAMGGCWVSLPVQTKQSR